MLMSAVFAQSDKDPLVLMGDAQAIIKDISSVFSEPMTAKEAFERGYLKDLLGATQGNISRASQIAGRYRADFYKLLKKYGLHPSDKPTDI